MKKDIEQLLKQIKQEEFEFAMNNEMHCLTIERLEELRSAITLKLSELSVKHKVF